MGILIEYYIIVDRKSKGYAFVEFAERKSANASLDFNGDIVGRSVVISLAKNKRKTPEEMRRRERSYF